MLHHILEVAYLCSFKPLAPSETFPAARSQVVSARVVGPPAGALTHGNAQGAALPLSEGAFAGQPSAGEWTLTLPQG